MALNSYSGLKSAALAWIDHAGVVGATSIIDDCVTLCEARINKTPTLRLSPMETELVLTLENGRVELPADYLAMKRVVAGYGLGGAFSTGFSEGFDVGVASVPVQVIDPKLLLSYIEPGWYDEAYASVNAGPDYKFYTIIGNTLRSHAGSVGILYYAKVPPLATTDPNWLLSKAPDVYLFGTILEVLNALEGDAAGKYGGLYNSAIEALIASETFSRGGVLTMRASMPAP